VLDYWRERVPLHVFIPVASALAIAADRGRSGAVSLTADVTLALLLLAATRLWDDLADRGRDGLLHPDRVLARARTVRGYGVTVVALGAAAATLVLLRPERVVGGLMLGLLFLLLAVLYAVRTRRSAGAELVLLSKYPAIVLIVAGSLATTRTLFGALMVYACACAYEAWHDRDSELGTLARRRRILWQ
jgi:4-hydroxybenzoate polyprenyltransferase